jgi:hypothetical protein
MSNSVIWQAMSSEIWEAVRRTGQVTSDGADECSNVSMTAISRVLFSKEFNGLESLNYTVRMLVKRKASLESKLRSKEIERTAGKRIKRELTTIQNSINFFQGLFTAAARERLLQIRKEYDDLAASKDHMESLLKSNLMSRSAAAESQRLHDEKLKTLDDERKALYDQFPELRDMQKAD